MSGLFGAPFQPLHSPNLPVRTAKDTKKNQSRSERRSSSGAHHDLKSQSCTSLQSSDLGQIPHPQIQDLDGTTLAPTGSAFEPFKDIVAVKASAFVDPAVQTLSSRAVESAVAHAIATVPFEEGTQLMLGDDAAPRPPEASQRQAGHAVSPLQLGTVEEAENRDYSPVMEQLDETMDLLKSMQVAARAANNSPSPAQTPQSLAVASTRDKDALSTPSISFSAHKAQKEAWLAGYSSGLALAHSQALGHIEELGNVRTEVTTQKDAVEELRAKYENLASQLSFLQGTCTQAFTGIWNALARNTNMVEERLQVEAALLSRVDSIDARVAANSVELREQQMQVVDVLQRMSERVWWQKVRSRVPHVPPHVLLQLLLGSAVAEFLLRNSSVVFGRRFRLGRALMRRIISLVALLSFLRLLLCAWRVAHPALNKIWVFLRTVSRPFAALYAATEKGEACRSFVSV
jgi:hypothetical protein